MQAKSNQQRGATVHLVGSVVKFSDPGVRPIGINIEVVVWLTGSVLKYSKYSPTESYGVQSDPRLRLK